jgi:hypothetical protein
MRRLLVVYEFATAHSEFPLFEENFIFFFVSVEYAPASDLLLSNMIRISELLIVYFTQAGTQTRFHTLTVTLGKECPNLSIHSIKCYQSSFLLTDKLFRLTIRRCTIPFIN